MARRARHTPNHRAAPMPTPQRSIGASSGLARLEKNHGTKLIPATKRKPTAILQTCAAPTRRHLRRSASLTAPHNAAADFATAAVLLPVPPRACPACRGAKIALRDDDIRFVRAMHPATHRLDPSPRALRAQTALGDPRAAADQGVDTEARLPAHR